MTSHILTPYSGTALYDRMKAEGHQIPPYLLFNLLYRKYGRFTDWLCRKVTYSKDLGYKKVLPISVEIIFLCLRSK